MSADTNPQSELISQSPFAIRVDSDALAGVFKRDAMLGPQRQRIHIVGKLLGHHPQDLFSEITAMTTSFVDRNKHLEYGLVLAAKYSSPQDGHWPSKKTQRLIDTLAVEGILTTSITDYVQELQINNDRLGMSYSMTLGFLNDYFAWQVRMRYVDQSLRNNALPFGIQPGGLGEIITRESLEKKRDRLQRNSSEPLSSVFSLSIDGLNESPLLFHDKREFAARNINFETTATHVVQQIAKLVDKPQSGTLEVGYSLL